MTDVSEIFHQEAVEADLRSNWRWLSLLAVERHQGDLVMQFRDDQRPADRILFNWGRVHAYAVREESFTNFDNGGEGGPLKELSGTGFQAWAAGATWRHGDETLRHWQITGSDEVIDVASLDPPRILKVD